MLLFKEFYYSHIQHWKHQERWSNLMSPDKKFLWRNRYMLATEMTVVPKQAPLPKLLAAPAVVNKDDDIYFIHIRMHRLRARDTTIATELDAKGGATIAYKRIGNEVYFAYAQCRIDHDVFSKRIGRTISKARLLGGRFDTIDVPQSASRSEVCRQLKKAYLEFQGAYIPEVTKYLY